MYLNNMAPLPINSSPGWVFPKQKFPNGDSDMLKFASKLIMGMVHFKQQLEQGQLPEELAPGRAAGPKMKLCMAQYSRLLNAYREPGNGQDQLDCSDALTPKPCEHIVVMAYDHLYKVPIKVNGTWLELGQVFHLLSRVQQEAINAPPLHERVPLLTSQARNDWFEAKQLLIKLGK